VDAVSNLVSAYVLSLTFSRNLDGVHDGSPYDKFLAKNNLPTAPADGESEDAYSQRLSQAINQLRNPVFVTPGDGAFETHEQRYAFGPVELQGLQLFLRKTPDLTAAHPQPNLRLLAVATLPAFGFVFLGWIGIRQQKYGLPIIAVAGCFCCWLVACGGSGNVDTSTSVVAASHVGNCIACHAAPNFTDFSMHNTGASQEEYDAIHGEGSFAQLAIPSYAEREANRDAYLPPTPLHPNSSGRFRAPAALGDLTLTDLGMWNVYANTDFPEPQARLQRLMCAPTSACDPNHILPLTIGRFKTPTLRDLGHSQPYLHTGRMNTIEKVLDFYRHTALLAQSGKLRNPDPAIGAISIDSQDETALAAFLRALNEDYN
jgi:hypothetical protein